MSIDHWLSQDGRRAVEKMGCHVPMEHTDDQCGFVFDAEGGIKHRVRLAGPCNWFCIDVFRMDEWHLAEESSVLEDYVALALLRDHARVWLEQHGIHICETDGPPGKKYYVPGSPNKDGWTEEIVPRDDNLRDYDVALIAAVLAVDAT